MILADNFDDLVCCFKPRTWATFIYRIQIILHTVGLILSCVLLVGLLNLGRDGFYDAIEDAKIPIEANYMAYSGALGTVIVSVGIFMTGAVFGIVLNKGVAENNTCYLNVWKLFALACAMGTVYLAVLHPSTWSVVLMLVFGYWDFFGIYVMESLIREIRRDLLVSKNKSGQSQDQVNWRTHLLDRNQPLPQKYVLNPDNNNV